MPFYELEFKKNIYLLLGLLLQVTVFQFSPLLGPRLSFIFFATGYSLFITGCLAYAQYKGYSRAWGFFGFLSMLGLIVLVFLPSQVRSTLQSERNRYRRETEENLSELKAAGSDFTKPHQLIHTFYVGRLESADRLMRLLREHNFQSTAERFFNRPNRRVIKVIEAESAVIPSLDAINEYTDTAVELADRCGARYDGWYTDVMKDISGKTATCEKEEDES